MKMSCRNDIAIALGEIFRCGGGVCVLMALR
jgi:hypothetical protein